MFSFSFSRINRFLILFFFLLSTSQGFCGTTDNQTDNLSPILPPDTLPFDISIEQANFSLPNGIHSYVLGVYKNQWLLLAGRTNGLHGFDNNTNNFPPSQQNTTVFVVDWQTGITYSKSLSDPTSLLTQTQIDLLSVTSPEDYQVGNTLYMIGGYGVDTATGLFSTKDCLTAIDIPGLIQWVVNPASGQSAAQSIRQIFDPFFQVTGGYVNQVNPHAKTLLIFGQNFPGFYFDSSNGNYTQQVRSFQIIDNGKNLYVQKDPLPVPNPNYRRRDLNVVPVVKKIRNGYSQGYVAFAGVFTEAGGVWTVPVTIQADGSSFMPDPVKPSTFKQGMNQYVCPTVGLFSQKNNSMYVIFLGGISYGFFQGGVFTTDPGIPFINQVTTVEIDKGGNYTQYLMDNEYPVILSTGSNPGNQLLFGAGARFISVNQLSRYSNGVFNLDKVKDEPILLGYIVGGIESTLPNTNTSSDSAASPYIFSVFLTKR